jgi:sn-glycerol 3-phosphate transport system substrate-binding protein
MRAISGAAGRIGARGLVSLALVGSLLAGCTADDRVGGTFDTTVDPADCGIEALEAEDGPVEIVFWHALAETSLDWLISSTKEFNASQDKVKVVLRRQPNYEDMFTKYKAGLASGDLPDLIQAEETVVQQMIDSRSTVPAQACIDATKTDLSDYLPRGLAYYSSGGVQRAMPWVISSPVLLMNRVAFEKAGLDPDDPPETLDEVREVSEKIVESGAAKFGIALKPAPFIFEFLLAKSGGEYVDNGNGRQARAVHANLDSPEALAIWQWWHDMVADGLALDTAGEDPANIDHILALANETEGAAMTLESSASIGPIAGILATGAFPHVKPDVAPLPALTPGGGVPVGDGALWMPKASDPAHRAAAWQFMTWLNSPERQAEMAAAGGYVPTRLSAVDQPVLQAKWKEFPMFRVAYDQLLGGEMSDANVGTLLGEYQGLRNAVRDGLIRTLRQNVDPEKAARDAKAEADIVIQEYNDRVGA